MRLFTLALLCFGSVVLAAPTPDVSIDLGDDGVDDSILKCKDLTLIDSHILSAQCQACFCDEYTETTIDLNTVIGNIDGKFQWDNENYSFSARSVSLEGSVLKAELRTIRRRYLPSSIDLAERIKNVGGKLTYVKP
ncbi:MAG: Cyanovirin-N [Benniella sp.]|nr:MAG: Cyanovirin-N [Benniella sp.]